MSNRTLDALRRADRAVVGALMLVLATAGAAIAYAPHADQLNLRATAVEDTDMNGPVGGTLIHAAVPSPAETALVSLLKERNCLADALYYEARGEGEAGQKAVAEVIFHRMQNRYYPSTICGVVFQGSNLRKGCQFSFTCSGEMNARKSPVAWARAKRLAANILTGAVALGDMTDDATSYHAVSVDPVWAGHLLKTVQIGNHIFYRVPPRTTPS